MEWNKEIVTKIDFDNITNKEEKQIVAEKIAQKVKDGDVIGFGSGSTSSVNGVVNVITFVWVEYSTPAFKYVYEK